MTRYRKGPHHGPYIVTRLANPHTVGTWHPASHCQPIPGMQALIDFPLSYPAPPSTPQEDRQPKRGPRVHRPECTGGAGTQRQRHMCPQADPKMSYSHREGLVTYLGYMGNNKPNVRAIMLYKNHFQFKSIYALLCNFRTYPSPHGGSS